jgi:hypothetical protein
VWETGLSHRPIINADPTIYNCNKQEDNINNKERTYGRNAQLKWASIGLLVLTLLMPAQAALAAVEIEPEAGVQAIWWRWSAQTAQRPSLKTWTRAQQ